MNPDLSARFAMRAATAADHERVDAAFARFDLADARGYRAFLKAQAGAFLPTEAAIEERRPQTMLRDWPARRRSHLLMTDLAELGVAGGPVSARPTFDGAPAVLGAVYVLEGSRLGGRMLARSVPQGLPRSFLTAGDATMWRELIAVLDASLISQSQLKAAIEAARAVFSLFEASATRLRETVS